MTQEEKAKAYDETLERFKSFKEKYYTKDTNFGDVIFDKTGEMQKDFESIFPELRESEDERIIEEIKFAVMQMPTERQDTKERCIAWLEKQKINTEGDFGRGYDCGYEACLNSHGAEWFKKQKHPNGCFTCDEYKKGYEEGRRNGFTAGYNKAMKEVDEQKEQKPVEWNEEDKLMIKCCLEAINVYKHNAKRAQFLPAQFNIGGYLASPQKVESWLKLLRNRVGKEFLQPHWKPSKEQLMALLRVVDKARELYYSSNSGCDEYNALRSLYEQLKKLWYEIH